MLNKEDELTKSYNEQITLPILKFKKDLCLELLSLPKIK